MGKRGPPPTPTTILLRRGSYRAQGRDGEPTPEAARPEQPAWLSKEAAAAWEQIVPELDAMGLLGRIDSNALARYCTLWARWRDCEDRIAKYGDQFTVKDKDGNAVGFKPLPYANQAVKIAQILGRLEGEFGMTPSARSRISLPTEAPKKEEADAYRLA